MHRKQCIDKCIEYNAQNTMHRIQCMENNAQNTNNAIKLLDIVSLVKLGETRLGLERFGRIVRGKVRYKIKSSMAR